MSRPLRMAAVLAGYALVLLPATAHAEPRWRVGPKLHAHVFAGGPNASALVGDTDGFATGLRTEHGNGSLGPTTPVPLPGDTSVFQSAAVGGDTVVAVVSSNFGDEGAPWYVVSGPLGGWPAPFRLADPAAPNAAGGRVVVAAGPGGEAIAARLLWRGGSASLLTAMADQTGTWHVATQSLGAVRANDLQVRWTSRGAVTTAVLTEGRRARIAVAAGLGTATISPFPHYGRRAPVFRHTATAADGSIVATWQEADRMLVSFRSADGAFAPAQTVATGASRSKGITRASPAVGGRHVSVLAFLRDQRVAVRSGIIGRPLGRLVPLGRNVFYRPRMVVTPRGRTAVLVHPRSSGTVGLGLRANGTVASRVPLGPSSQTCGIQDGPFGGGDETAVAYLQCLYGPYVREHARLAQFR